MKTIELHNYNIIFDDTFKSLERFLDSKNYSKKIVLVDENTKEHCLPIFSKNIKSDVVIEIQSGEANKNIDTCELIWKSLIDYTIDRNAVFINLGGGVIGDMGGFAASCYKRGIDFIQIPTTVLSQVDSSIGGKLGIDFKYGKNLIGLFQNPKLVYINKEFLKTLPKRQYINGFAEIFKHALIQDAVHWQTLKNIDIYNENIDEVLYQSLLVKKQVVEADPFEKGLRKILNFGHTIGHAIEAYSLENEANPLLHGEAIAIGMICEAYLSYKKTGLSETELREIHQTLLSYFPKYNISKFPTDKIIQSMMMDKKNKGKNIQTALLNKIGNCVFDINIIEKEIADSLDFYKFS
ncbi:MAG TPA: 3-dehydroquinate synthase [Chitinophagales bacterium]|nr:3-dehydroquinate synthase [Chitinophagales bacterium]HMU99130.1 3-dehydroquinate synthase [Chitinophagales bacterium]HMV02367.1 3-dehydroquinate synthase [Chitinophagales bacterium]HMW94458.1 3-dehydroquinate synthase [Chitinophagales bacterium]HMY42906.1 3-dehydroquinate synthase [Chitinophagales bacterium]